MLHPPSNIVRRSGDERPHVTEWPLAVPTVEARSRYEREKI
jgi:hypothetical protein